MTIIRVKRRAMGGAAGAPATLKTSEIAYNETDDTMYVGFGDNGAGQATSVRSFAGAGAFATKQYVTDAMQNTGAGDMLKSVYDPTGKNASAFNQDNFIDGATNKNYTAGEKTKLAGIAAGADVTSSATVASILMAVASKATLVAGDKLAILDSAATGVTKTVLYENLLATMQTAIVAAITNSAPGTLDTLGELAAALGNDPNFATSIATAIAAKAPLASPAFTGNPTAPTPAQGDNDTSVATTAFVQNAIATATIDGGTF